MNPIDRDKIKTSEKNRKKRVGKMVITLFSVCLFAVLVNVVSSKSLHLPGVSPSSYNDNDPVKVYHILFLKNLSHMLPHSYIDLYTYSFTYYNITLVQTYLLTYLSCL